MLLRLSVHVYLANLKAKHLLVPAQYHLPMQPSFSFPIGYSIITLYSTLWLCEELLFIFSHIFHFKSSFCTYSSTTYCVIPSYSYLLFKAIPVASRIYHFSIVLTILLKRTENLHHQGFAAVYWTVLGRGLSLLCFCFI